MSVFRTSPAAGRVRRGAARGPNGRGLCRWCDAEVPERRRTFCGDDCVHQWKLRSDPGYLRDQVFARDGGICALCGLDTVALMRRIRHQRRAVQQAMRRERDIPPRRQSLWDADHVVPVAEGGGECDLANMRTLCLWCHRVVTAHLASRLRARTPVVVATSNP